MADKMSTSRRQSSRTVNIVNWQTLAQDAGIPAFGDFYHQAMKTSWPLFFTGAAAVFLILNSCFALVYAFDENPIANARPGSLVDLFFFSV
jgi:inward rectifier potassium channel